MRDWKKRWIVAGILFVVCMIILISRIISYREEGTQMREGVLAKTPEELTEAIQNDGIVYAKGLISGSLNADEITLNDGVLSADPANIVEGQPPFVSGEYMGLEANVGRYEYDKDKYESNRILEHHFYAKKSYFIHTDTISILDMTIDVRNSEHLFDKMGTLKQRVGDGSLQYDKNDKMQLPTSELLSNEKIFDGFELYAYPSEVEGAVKLVIQNGEIQSKETTIFPASELEIIEDIATTGTMDYGTEIGAWIILWIVLTLIAWLIMRFIGY